MIFSSKESVPFVLTVRGGITGHLTHVATESLGLHPGTSPRKLKTTPLPSLSTSASESLELMWFETNQLAAASVN